MWDVMYSKPSETLVNINWSTALPRLVPARVEHYGMKVYGGVDV
jgi:hypothetical protein